MDMKREAKVSTAVSMGQASNLGIDLEALDQDRLYLEADIETFTALQDKLVTSLEAENIEESEAALTAMNMVMQNIMAKYRTPPLQELWQAIYIFFENIKKEVGAAKQAVSLTKSGEK